MNYNFNDFEGKLSNVKEWLIKELAVIRTGRSTVAILDDVRVNTYGSQMPLNQVASVNIEDPKTLRVNPYDTSQIKDIESAINSADLGLSVVTDEKGLRVIFPDLTSERREMLIKQAGQKLEESKISLRKEREDVWNDIQEKQKAGEISEDDKFKLKDEMQKKVDDIQKEFEEMVNTKENEIKS